MSDDVQDIAFFYNSDPEREHNRLAEHQLEYDLTWRYLSRCLPSHGSILEIGAATGRYTLELARRGYAVTAVDLSTALLEECMKNIAAEGLEKQVRFVVADARDLGNVPGKEFDAVLLMGPLYHLVVESDRILALKESLERLRNGGILFSAFLSRMGVFGDLIKRAPAWIENQAEVRSILARGQRPDNAPPGGFRGYFAQVSEIGPLHEALGFETMLLAGVDSTVLGEDESYNRLEGNQREFWLDLLEEISTEKSTLGSSRHLLYIGKKS